MRVMVAVLGAAGLMLIGCTKQDGSSNAASTVTPAATATPAASFTPPTSISRADYGGRVERRFRKLDKNGDDKLEKDELPAKRADKLVRRMDANGDGVVDAAEWSKAMLAKFDKQDANRDGNLTSDERGKHGGKDKDGKDKDRDGGRRHGGGKHRDAMEDDGDEVDNGF